MVPLRVEGLKVVRNNKKILEISELELREKELLCVVGPNGAGKTTLLLAMSCLMKPFSGKIFFMGREIGKEFSEMEYKRRISVVFQEPLLFNTTVFENVASGLRIRGFRKKEIKEKVEKYLDLFKISHLSGRNAHKLSGGEAKRVSLARACVIEPHILFLDEPFSSLDLNIKESLIHDFLKLKDLTNTTFVLATHDREEVLRLGDRICVLSDGNILQVGKVEEVMENPRDEWIASFFGIDAVLERKVIEKLKFFNSFLFFRRSQVDT